MADHHRIQRLEVQQLFGRRNYKLDFSNVSPVTVLTGPNGSGKTHILRILRALLNLDFKELFDLPYTTVTLRFSDRQSIKVKRQVDKDDTILSVKLSGVRKASPPFYLRSSDFEDDEPFDLPSWIVRIDRDKWYDERRGRPMSLREMEQRYGGGRVTGRRRRAILEKHPELEAFIEKSAPTLIDTKRLDTPAGALGQEVFAWGSRQAIRGGGRMGRYVGEIQAQVAEARRNSLVRSQQADERFASNLLKSPKNTAKHEDLVQKYELLSNLSDELSENGLAGKVLSVDIPEQANDTQMLVLDLFLQDWERKLEPLLPIHRKLTALRRIVNNKFIDKSLGFDPKGGVVFVGPDGAEIGVDQLSSGEQHLLALFTLLLFSADEHSTVLIDEPEISLHAAWKHAFIDDIEEVAAISELTVVMATHSTAIINGRWELVRELANLGKNG